MLISRKGISWLLAFVLVCSSWVCSGLCWEIDYRQELNFSSEEDIIGITELGWSASSDLSLSFDIDSAPLGIDISVDQWRGNKRFRAIDEIISQISMLDCDVLRNDLEQAMIKLTAGLGIIRAMSDPISITELKEQVKLVCSHLKEGIVDPLEEACEEEEQRVAQLLILVEPIKKGYDYLAYIIGKVSLYAVGETREELAGLLWRIVVSLSSGNKEKYIHGLEALLIRVEQQRGLEIKEEEADRIRYKADYLLREIAGDQVEKQAQIVLSNSFLGVDLDSSLEWNVLDHSAPSKDKLTRNLGFALGVESESWTGSFSYDYEARDYLDLLKNDDDRLAHRLNFNLKGEIASLQLAESLSLQHEYYPYSIGHEIDLVRLEEARAAVQTLIDCLRQSGTSLTIETELMEILEAAYAALENEDCEGVVDELNDFVSEIYDDKWEGEMGAGIAKKLIDSAMRILPRKREKQLSYSSSVEFPVCDASIGIDVRRIAYVYPADSSLTHTATSIAAQYSGDWDGISAICSIEREKTCYPLSQYKDKQVDGEELELEGSYKSLCWELVWSQEFTGYPKRSYNNKHVRKGELGLEMPLSILVLAVKASRQLTSYPNNAEKPLQCDEKVSLAGNLSVFGMDLEATLTNKTRRAEQLVETTDTFKLSVDTEVTEWLSCEGFVEWEHKTYWEDRGEDNGCFRLGVEFSLAVEVCRS